MRAAKGVMVTNTPDVLTEEVADTAIGLLLNTVRELPKAEAWLRDGRWVKEGAYPLTRMTLRGRRVGIFGMGRIGRAIARRLEAFGLPIAYHNRRPVEGVAYDYHPTLAGLAEAVDTLISVAPGGAATEKAVDAKVLAALGPNGVFVNIGRGSTVDESALVEALASGTIRAAGLDVFENEPHVPQALIDLPECMPAAACRFGIGAHTPGDGRSRCRQSDCVVLGGQGIDASARNCPCRGEAALASRQTFLTGLECRCGSRNQRSCGRTGRNH